MKYAKWRRRLRGTCKWGGVTLCVLLFALWLASGFRVVVLVNRNESRLIQCGVSGGLLWGGMGQPALGNPPDPAEFARWMEFPHDPLSWKWAIRPSVWDTGFIIPLWLPFLLIALPTGFLFWSDHRRRTRAGCCGMCGYSLTGNTTGRCPECGATTPARAAT